MNKVIQIIKGGILVVLFVFLYFSFVGPTDSSAQFDEVTNKTLENIDLSSYEQKDNISIKKFLQIDPENYENIIYYKNTDVMQADEIVIVKFKDHSQQKDFNEAMDQRVSEQENIFSGYAPAEEEKLKSSIIDIQANYALYVVSSDAQTIDEQFLQSLE